MAQDSIQADVEKLNAALGGEKDASLTTPKKPAGKKPPKKAAAKEEKSTDQDGGIGIRIPMKHGIPALPASMIRVSVGAYDDETEKDTGFRQIGIAVVEIGIPVPLDDGKTAWHPFTWIDHKVEVRTGEDDVIEEVRLIGPFWASKRKGQAPADGTEQNSIYPAAMVNFRDRVVRTVLDVIRRKKMRRVRDIWDERRQAKAFSDHLVRPKKSEAVELSA